MTEVLAVALVVSWVAFAVKVYRDGRSRREGRAPLPDGHSCDHLWGPWSDPAEHTGGIWSQGRRCELCNLHEDRSWSELRGRAYTTEEWDRIDRAVEIAVHHMKNCRQVEAPKPE